VHQIQSGQVIVDLCCVVKELVENSLDAGATNIDVRFRNQGLDGVEVQDNGPGITPDNYDSLALKHHTSKLVAFSDISTIRTFGFRGEALSSLCALSRFSVVTCLAANAPKGTRLEFESSGRLKGTSVVAAQKGTTVYVNDVFFNLPVRRRELERNIKREWNKVIVLLNQYACIQTNLNFTVSQQPSKGKRVLLFSTKGNETTRENIINVFGAKAMAILIPLDLKLDIDSTVGPSLRSNHRTAEKESNQVRVQGFVSRPAYGEGRQTPDRQMFFVNERPCLLPQFSKTFNEVYKSYSSSQSPFIFANIQLDTHLYDLNVSPDKRTILLHDQTRVLESLRDALASLFESHDYSIPTSQTVIPRPISRTRQSLLTGDRAKPYSSPLNKLTSLAPQRDIGHIDDSLLYHCRGLISPKSAEPPGAALQGIASQRTSLSINCVIPPSRCRENAVSRAEGASAHTAVILPAADPSMCNSDTLSQGSEQSLHTQFGWSPGSGISRHQAPIDYKENEEGDLEAAEHGWVIDGTSARHVDVRDPVTTDDISNHNRPQSDRQTQSHTKSGRRPLPSSDKETSEEQPPKVAHYSGLTLTVSRSNATLHLVQTMSSEETAIPARINDRHFHARRISSQCCNSAAITREGFEADNAEETLSLIITKGDFARMSVVGQFNLGFILAVRHGSGPRQPHIGDDNLFIIDQHASDEKFNFERLQLTTALQSQSLVHPKRLELTALEEEIVQENLSVLELNGFKVRVDESGSQPVGSRCELLSLPLSRETTFTIADLEELVSLLSDSRYVDCRSAPRPSKVRKMFAMRACRSSIMIGTTLTSRQMTKLVRHMGDLDKPWNCPHGRPTMRHLYRLGAWDGKDWDEGSWSKDGKGIVVNWRQYSRVDDG
ncbi:hypothetical protein ACRALDRAFT_1035222, partial [Sodiomyces alcalophilus JCM 7366]|uniref:uncharacterized protein n=1 Tax=Sodiomyces alcalophilus JCM 7366 TaxID=591952 RepID=UPI0039B6B880